MTMRIRITLLGLLTILISMAISPDALGQITTGGSSGVASSFKKGTPLPAACTVGQVFADTTASPAIFYVCPTTNTFAAIATGASFSCSGCTVNTIPKTSGAGTQADSSIGDNGLSVSPIVDNTVPLGDLTHRFSNGFFGGVIKWTNGAGTADLGISRDINSGNSLDIGSGGAQATDGQLNLTTVNSPSGALQFRQAGGAGVNITNAGGGTLDLQGNGIIRWGNGNGTFSGPDVSLVRVAANILGVNTGSFPGFAGSLMATNFIGGNATTSPLTLKSTTGIGTTGADIIFQAGNNGATEVMRVLNAGSLEIGSATAQSTEKLGVSHSGDSIQAITQGDFVTAASKTGIYLRTTTEGRISVASSGVLTFYTAGPGGTERIRMDSSGNLGVGTSNPLALLAVGSASQFQVNTAGAVTSLNGVATAGAVGVPPVRGVAALVTQSATVGPTNLYAAAPVGTYRVCYAAYTTTAGTGVTGNVTISWNDGNAKAFVSSNFLLTTVDITGQVNGCQTIHSAAAQNITYTVTVGTPGNSVWAFEATAEQLR